mgnify:CR=1 FL=1
MKTLTLAILFVATLFNGSTSFANDNGGTETSVSITQSMSGEKKAVIRIDNLLEEQKTLLKIKNERGRVLHTEVIHQAPTFIRTYDFSKVEGNNYSVEVLNNENKVTKTFKIKPTQDVIYFKPVVRTEDGVIKVVFQNPLETSVSIYLYDKHNHLIYETKVASQEIYAQGLDVSHLRKEKYELTLLSENYAYSKKISTR